MKTVAKMKEELSKFPDDALCYAYEGEVIGLIIREDISKSSRILLSSDSRYGFIPCSESARADKDAKVEYFDT